MSLEAHDYFSLTLSLVAFYPRQLSISLHSRFGPLEFTFPPNRCKIFISSPFLMLSFYLAIVLNLTIKPFAKAQNTLTVASFIVNINRSECFNSTSGRLSSLAFLFSTFQSPSLAKTIIVLLRQSS